MLPFPIAGDYHLPTKLSFKGLGKMEKVENRWQLLVIWLVATESIKVMAKARPSSETTLTLGVSYPPSLLYDLPSNLQFLHHFLLFIIK